MANGTVGSKCAEKSRHRSRSKQSRALQQTCTHIRRPLELLKLPEQCCAHTNKMRADHALPGAWNKGS
eukprot:1141312-Pelagomonas_calceolata.AAC.1